jgi:hypothetical protein
MGKAGKARKQKQRAQLVELAQAKLGHHGKPGSGGVGSGGGGGGGDGLSPAVAALTCRTLRRLLVSSSLRSSALAKPIRRSVFAWPEMTPAEIAGVSVSSNPQPTQEPTDDDGDSGDETEMNTDEAMQLAAQTLDRLAADSQLLYSAEAAGVRLAVSSLQPLLGTSGKSTQHGHSNVGDALHEQMWAEAEVQLRHMRENGKAPRLGALQRWIRDLFIPGAADTPTAARLLSEILLTCGQTPYTADDDGDSVPSGKFMQVHPLWKGHFDGDTEERVDDERKSDDAPDAGVSSPVAGDHDVVVLSTESSWKGGVSVWGCAHKSTMASFCVRDKR